jgi:hypothetical protein
LTYLGDSLTQALRAAPELNTAPNLALAVAQDPAGDPTGTAQAVAHSANQTAQQTAIDNVSQKVGHPNLLHQTLGWLGHRLGGSFARSLNQLGAPLREVQHQYRYFHDVEARHGPIAALVETIPVATAAGVGGYFGGQEGGIAAAELAAGAEGRIVYRDSWKRTTVGADYQGRYNRETGEYEGPAGTVSPGRDISDALGLKPGSKPFTFSSAALDGLADLVADPLAVGGKFYAGARSAQGISRLGNEPLTAFSHAPQGETLAIRGSDLETRVAKIAPVRRAFTEMAGMNAGQIVNNYPKFEGIADELGRADSFDKVVDVFRNHLMAKELASSTMPSMSFTRIPFAKLSRAIQYADVPGQGIIRSMTSLLPTYFDKETLELSNKGFATGDANAIRGIGRVMRFSQSRQVAESVMTEFANAMDDPAKQILIYKNGLRSMLVAAGLPEDSQFVLSTVDEMAQRAMGGGEAVYGVDQVGRNLSKVPTEKGSSSLGILQSQQGNLAFPDFPRITSEVRSLERATKYFGAADDWLYEHFTRGIFMKLVLLSGGFAQRIAAAEAIPAALRQGVGNIIRSRLAASGAKDISEEELSHYSAAVAKALGGVNKLVGDADKTDFVVNIIHDNGGHIVSTAIDTTTPSAEVGAVERHSRTIYNGYKQVPDKYKLGDHFGIFGPSDRGYTSDTWGRWLSQVSNDPASQEAAKAYMAALGGAGGSSVDEAIREVGSRAAALGGAEHGLILDAEGNRVGDIVQGDHAFVAYGQSVPPGGTEIHTHPTDTPFSLPDIENAGLDRVGTTVVVGPNKTYRLDITPRGHEVLSDYLASGAHSAILSSDDPEQALYEVLQDLSDQDPNLFHLSETKTMLGPATPEDATEAGAQAAKAWWDAQPANVVNRMGRHYAVPPGAEGVDPHELWGQAIMDNVKGATHAPLDMGGAPAGTLLVRYDQPEANLAPELKPHGTFYSHVTDPSTFESPHAFLQEEEGAVQHTARAAASNPLEVTTGTVDHPGRPGLFPGHQTPESGAIAALKKLVAPEEFERIIHLPRAELEAEMTQKFPGHDWSQYFDTYELSEAYAAQLARKEGFDSIIAHDPVDARHNEFIALKASAVAPDVSVSGHPHMQLLANVAEGKQTPFEALDEIPREQWPVHLPGRELIPDTTSTIDRIANVGFRKVLDPIINFLSREPLYVNEAYNQYKYLKPLIDSGEVLPEEARAIAQVRATVGVLPFIHNTMERSQFSTLARNFMPFYFAQEQAYKRFGRLLADDPGAFRQFQLMITGLHEAGSTATDPNGQSWLTYPGAGFLSQGTVSVLGKMGIPVVGSVPVSFSGQLKSLNTVFPFAEGVRPSFGPVVSIASHLIENRFPELSPAVHTIIGDQAASGSIYDQLIPNQTLKGVIQALDPGMRSRSMQNAMMHTIQNMAYRQEKAMKAWTDAGNDPNSLDAPQIIPKSTEGDQWQKFMDRVKNQTRITFIVKTAIGAVTPAAPITNVGDWGLRADARDLIKKLGVSAGLQAFHEQHPDATPYEVFLSKSTAGAPLSATTTGQNWINDNLDLLHRYPNAGAWFIPQVAGEFNQGVYNEQMAQHLRAYKSPEQVMNDIYVAAGNDQFYNRDLPTYRKALADAEASGDKHQAQFIRADFANYVKTVLGPQKPGVVGRPQLTGP